MILHGSFVDVCAGPALLLGLGVLGICLCCVGRRNSLGLLASGLGFVLSATAFFALWADRELYDEPLLCAIAALALLANACALVLRMVVRKGD